MDFFMDAFFLLETLSRSPQPVNSNFGGRGRRFPGDSPKKLKQEKVSRRPSLGVFFYMDAFFKFFFYIYTLFFFSFLD